jgi:ATP phosphoribosyltransferase regulatory subunit
MQNSSLGLPAGFRDVLFEEAKARRLIEANLAEVFERRGYREIAPSGVEFQELYTRGEQSVRDRVFRFLDRDDNLLALRADFTPAIARIVCTRLASAEMPIRVWYSGNVFRKVDPGQGRFCETGQVGAELIGSNSSKADAEVIDLALACLTAVGIDDVQVHINHADIFRGIIDVIAIGTVALRQVKSEIDHKDTRGLAARLRQLGVSEDVQSQLNCLSDFVGGADILARARSAISNSRSRRALDELIELASRLDSSAAHIVFDLAEIDELEYYSGIMLQFYSPKARGELGGGGRYDSLLGEFGRSSPAVGFSFSMDKLIELR